MQLKTDGKKHQQAELLHITVASVFASRFDSTARVTQQNEWQIVTASLPVITRK